MNPSAILRLAPRGLFFLTCLSTFLPTQGSTLQGGDDDGRTEVPVTLPTEAEKKPALRGIVHDARTGDILIGANVFLKSDRHRGAVTGLDGSFRIDAAGVAQGSTWVCTCLGYASREITPADLAGDVDIRLDEMGVSLGEAVVMAHNPGRTESGARELERRAIGVTNVMSAKAIELSPDLTVAAALGRMSGITLERSASGEGQYAILRGMDKRYNYTLVNGVKIPSPDNKNRFVPLDIFPAELLDRLEVTKSLTARDEGDGIGGAVNLVMKNAPDRRLLSASASAGYSSLFFDRSFSTFSTGGINSKSPNERYGTAHTPAITDFSTSNLALRTKRFVPDLTASLAYGDRFFDKRLGIIAAASVQNLHRGKESDLYYNVKSNDNSGVTQRTYAEQQTRLGAHLRADYALSPAHTLALYTGYLFFRNQQVRDIVAEQSENLRFRLNTQGIFNTTLSGEHHLLDEALTINWRGIYAKATSRTPDNTQINLTTARSGAQTVAVNSAALRRWEHNADEDLAAHIDLSYRLFLGSGTLTVQGGGMYRDKQRESFFNEYTFSAAPEQRDKVRGRDWTNFDQIRFTAPRYGNLADPLNYDATERVGAAYLSTKYEAGRWLLTAGVRAEHTDQGYDLAYPTEGNANSGAQRYWDFLPDVHAKYTVHRDGALRLSYARAINRPSFFEIVPYKLVGEDYSERGNPDLRHTVADNFDLRYEFFPRPTEQLMMGLFYKRIADPIEYGLQISGQDSYYTPENFGTAHNLGLELDVTKYFHSFGIKANYTYTHSRIKTGKMVELPNPDPNAPTTTVTRTVQQVRPLFGQAAHVANLSLLYKDVQRGWDGQLSLNYTGKRLCVISRFLDDDVWEDGIAQLDASMEKKFGKTGFSLYAKAGNLLNLPLTRYIERNPRNENITDARRHAGGLLERKDRHGRTFLIGARFKL